MKPPGALRRAEGWVRGTPAQRVMDRELARLRRFIRLYSKAGGPDVFVFGDSALFWTDPTEKDESDVVEMIRRDLGPRITVEAFVGAGYFARTAMAYLSALPHCEFAPRAVVVPTSTVMASTMWLAHPRFNYERAAEVLRRARESGNFRRERVSPPDTDTWERFDRTTVASLERGQRPLGEMRLLADMVPTTPWQAEYRLRGLTDFYLAERIEPNSPGLAIVAELGAMLRELKLPSVAYIAPLNYQGAERFFGRDVRDHLAGNAAVVAEAFQGAVGETGRVVNAVLDCSDDEFFDSAHTVYTGRQRLARKITEALRGLLETTES